MVAAIRIANIASLFSEGVEHGQRRDAGTGVHSESLAGRAGRIVGAAARLAASADLGALCAGASQVLRDRLVGQTTLPDAARPLSAPAGLCGAAHDLQPMTVFQAYQQGLVLRAPAGPATWWSPTERRLVRPVASPRRGLQPVFDRDADRVIARVSRENGRRDPLLAETPALRALWSRLAARGLLHTFETLDHAGHGLAIGRMFILTGFHAQTPEASQAAMETLETELAARCYAWLDLTLADPAGDLHPAETFRRAEFLALLASNPDGESAGPWRGLSRR